MRLAPDRVDVRRFERLLERGAPREALALWRGRPLDDVADEPFAAAEIRRLEELRLAAIERAVDEDLAAGRHVELVGELELLVAEHPLHERVHGQLMLALYRCGRQADALEAYRRARAVLVEEIGMEPGPELQRLHDAILRHDPSLAVAEDGAAPSTETALADGAVVACPFKGLACFEVEDADVFFGRERLVSELVARVTGAPVLGVVGPSGSGKSSLLRAGLLASLSAGALPGSERWRIELLRPGERPLRTLTRARAAARDGERLALAIDQLEEVFSACDREMERVAFFDALVACARDERRRTVVLVALRADFYGRCAAYPEFARVLSENHVLVGPMGREELRRAIELPARRAGLSFEPELIDALIAGVEGQPGALPLLSASLLELWLHRDGRLLRMSAYESTGGVDGAVARLAETTYERLDPRQRAIARRILLRLTGDADAEGSAVVRRRVPLAELEADRDERVSEVLSELAHDRLVTIGDGAVEVAHEALLREWPRLRGWLEEDAQGRRLHNHLRAAAHAWEAGERDPGELYRGARLPAALEWSAAHAADLNATERAFLAESRGASERSQRRLRAVLAGVAALLVLSVIAGVIAVGQRAKARDEATAADAQRLGSRALVEADLDRALLLARQGVALDDSVQTRGNLLAAVLKSPAAIGVLRADAERIVAAALSPDEHTLAVGNIPGRVSLFDTRTRRHVATLSPTPNGAAIAELAFSPDGSRLAVAHAIAPGDPYTARPFGIAVTVLDVRTHRTVTRLTLPRGRPITGLRFSPDARTIGIMLTAFPEGASAFTRFNARTGRRVLGPVRVNRRGYSPLMISGDGHRMVVVGDDGVTLRDAETLEVLKRFRGVRLGAALTASSLHFITVSAPYALSNDGRTVALGYKDGSLRLLDLKTGDLRTASGRHAAGISDARFTPDGRRVITTGDDGNVIVWDAQRAAATETLSGHAGFVFSPMISRDGATLYTASLDGTVIKWDLAGARRLGRPLRVGAEGTGAAGVALSSDGDVLASARGGGAIAVIDADSLHERPAVRVLPTGNVSRLVFVPGGHLLVVGGDNGRLALFDADSGRVIRLRGHRGYMLTPGASADGRLLVTASVDGTVRLWSLPDGRPVGAPLRFPHGVYDAQLSPDGRRLTIVPFAGPFRVQDTLEVWDVRNRRRMLSVRPGANTSLVRFSPDGRLVAVGNNNGRARVWSTTTWKPVTRSFGPHAGVVSGAAISRDDRTLATGSDDGTVRLWDIQTGQAIGAPLPGQPNRTVAPSFTAHGTHLLAGYESGDAYLWDIRPASLARQACRVAGRRLTRAEWNEFLPGRDYDPAC